jgi:predicted amidohydrolase
MPRKLKVAPVQMDAAPAPLESRLARAADLVARAAEAGAQLVVLPELFNTGYEYHERNYGLAEPIDGQTVQWMKAQAAQHNVHLAGSLLLLDDEDIYNAALLVAPDGRTWRYDKQYPFSWERVYFRGNNRITVAQTDIGCFGMMICWDTAHADLWARYAGRVDALLILSSPPKLSSGDLVFPDGLRVNTRELGGIWTQMYTEVEYFPGPDMDEHAVWIGVPVVHASGAGAFRSRMPAAAASLSSYLGARPDLWPRLVQAPEVHLEAGYDLQTKVIDADGKVIARVMDKGDGFTLAEITLAASRPQPKARQQPPMRTPPAAYLFADSVAAGLGVGLYRQGVRRQWGARMAPVDPRTRSWLTSLAALLAAFWFVRRLLQRVTPRRLRSGAK